MNILEDKSLEVLRLRNLLSDALAALNDGRMGDVRRILVKGNDTPLRVCTGVLVKGRG
jgi:hypothetical protein